VLSLFSKRYFLPILAALASFILFQLALHHPVNARAFSSLQLPSILAAGEFDGVYTHLVARLLHSIFRDAELSFRLLTALATGFSVYFVQKLFPPEQKWSASYVIANISFLYFAMHSLHGMLIVLLFTAYLSTWDIEKPTRLPMAGLLATLMLGLDSLLAIALILYSLLRIFGAESIGKTKAVAITSIVLGISVWALLAYMLYASSGFMTALSAGFDQLFEQINPINFGVGLLVTFNLLLIWVFRAPSEKTSIKYLGSLLIALFLFVRVEPIHLVLLLILGVAFLQRTAGLPKQRWVQPVYALLNVASFFLLPPIAPLEASYNVRAEKPSDAALYTSSYFANDLPAYRSLISKAEMLDASRSLALEKSHVPVILDPSLEASFDRAALRARGSVRMIGGFDASTKRFQTVFGRDTSMMTPAKSSAYLRYLATDALPRPMDSMLVAAQAPMTKRDGVRYYRIDSSHYTEFFDTYIYHHYLSFH
jgi:hypothetical protein